MLPFSSKKAVHAMYTEDSKGDPNIEYGQVQQVLPCALSYFRNSWKSSHRTKHIKLLKWLRFSLCDACVEFRNLKANTRHVATLKAICIKEKAHHEHVHRERAAYYARREAGGSRIHNCLSLIVDGASQSAYALPYLYETTHTTASAFRLPVLNKTFKITSLHIHDCQFINITQRRSY